MTALLIVVVLELVYISSKLEEIAKHARRAGQNMSVDEEMDELNPNGISGERR